MASNDVRNSLNNDIVKGIANDFLAKVHNRAEIISNDADNNIYSSVKDLGYRTDSSNNIRSLNNTLNKKNINSYLVADVLQKIVDEYSAKQEESLKEHIYEQINSMNLIPTKNHMFMRSEDNKYYILKDLQYVEEPSVLDVDEYGNYTIKSELKNCTDYLVSTYNIENKPISFKILNSKSETYKSERYVAKKLNMKKEFVNKYKLHGYSGNSKGFFATIANFVSSPVPSGCYFDKSYTFFKWNIKSGQFDINVREGLQCGSPLLADYEIKDDMVVRTDYDGVGILI